jgi:ankyrin repeat protein
MACNHSGSCQLFPLMAMEPALNLWKKHYCDGTFDNCARYQLSVESKPVPLTLLPNGKQLAPRSREQINAAALFNAIEKGRVPLIKSMIKTGIAKMAAQTSHGMSPLMAAAKVGNMEIVNLMLEHGCNPWRKNPDGNTALDIATAGGHQDCIHALQQKMESTTPDDYTQLPATTLEDESEETIEEAKGNIISVLKRLNPFAR